MAATSLCPWHPDSRPLGEGLPLRPPRLGAPRGGRLARMLQGRERGTPGPSLAPRGRDPPWLSLVSQKTEAAWPSPGPGPRPGQPLQQGLSLAVAFSRPAVGCAARGGEATAVGPGSFLVVIGGVREDKLEAVGLGQQQADVFVAPVGCGQVLEEEQQLLRGERQPGSDGAASCVRQGPRGRSPEEMHRVTAG